MNDQFEEMSLEDKLRSIASGLSSILPGKGFALVVFDFGGEIGKKRSFSYVSNAVREDMHTALVDFADAMKEQGT